MTRCPPLCGQRSPKKEKVKRVVTLEEEKIVRWAIDNKENWEMLGNNARGMLSDVSRFPPKSHHLSDHILTLSCFPFCDILCEPLNLLLDFVGIYVRYPENGALTI